MLLFKQFGPRSGRIKCLAWSGSKLFDTGGARKILKNAFLLDKEFICLAYQWSESLSADVKVSKGAKAQKGAFLHMS